MTEVLLSERTRPKKAVQLKVEKVKMPRTMAQIFKYEGPFRFLIKRAMEDDQHAGTAGGNTTSRFASLTRSQNTPSPGLPAPRNEGE